MSKFCTKCGKELTNGEKCSCQENSFLSVLKSVFVDGVPVSPENDNLLERNKKIVPDCVKADEGETPIKQYRLTRLRSRFRGQYAEGRLQVTNKRLLFRATGVSSLGKTAIQQEFSINDIAGIEIKQDNRISFLNVFLCIIATIFISSEAEAIFSAISSASSFFATFLAFLFPIGCLAFFFLCKKLYWAKLLAFSVSVGALLGSSSKPLSPIDIVLNFELFSITNVFVFILSLGWFYTMLRVCVVPDLLFSVKTNSAGDAIQIRRRVWGTFFKQPQEYTGFSEVLPWQDTDKAMQELGALINDLQTMGDVAIELWGDECDADR